MNEDNDCQPKDGKPASEVKGASDDFSNLDKDALKMKASDLQNELFCQQKKTDDYKKKCAVLTRTRVELKEQALKVDQELDQFSEQMNNNLNNLQRNKDSILKTIDFDVASARERVQKVRDQSTETRTQLDKVKRSVDLMTKKKEERNRVAQLIAVYIRGFYNVIMSFVFGDPAVENHN